MSIGLVLLLWKTTDPYRAHLLGLIKPPKLLPFALPYNTGDRPLFSEMSFKCRSTSTFSSYTIAEPHEDILYKMYPTRPEKAYGLGIYAPKASTAGFLTPRPSLRTIRSQASFGSKPLKCSPVPPLPVYDPEKYRNMPVMQKQLHPQKRVYSLRWKNSQQVPRVGQHAPMPSDDRPHTFDRSASRESLSSIYSRSVSGNSPDPSRRPVHRRTSGRQLNVSTALATVGRNHLYDKQSDLGLVGVARPWVHSRVREDRNSQMVDDRMRAPAELPIVRAVSAFGNVQDWGPAKGQNAKPVRDCRTGTWTERCNLPPLLVERSKKGR